MNIENIDVFQKIFWMGWNQYDSIFTCLNVRNKVIDLLTTIFSKIVSHDIPPSEKTHVFYSFFRFFGVFQYLLELRMHFSGQTSYSFVYFKRYNRIQSKFSFISMKYTHFYTFLCVFLPFFAIFWYFSPFLSLKSPKPHHK